MGSPSKEERILELFLNEPSKHWHFEDIITIADVSRPVANKWLKSLLDKKIIKHIKPEGKMPYFQANTDHLNYDNKKRIYAMRKLYETGLLQKLQSLQKAETVIIFGSWYRGDWYTKSDIDIFIYGDPEEIKHGTLWKGLGFQGKSRELQIHSFKTRKDIKNIKSGLMKNIIKGYFVKGDIHNIAEVTI
ncbi:MAG: nucleotidyltransferase domain-containing protein [Candidatus Woesearchaeota archaeon]